MRKFVEVDIIAPGTRVKVFGVGDNTCHGEAVVLPSDFYAIYKRSSVYEPGSYQIKFYNPFTDNARNWNNGSMEGSWIGRFIEIEAPPAPAEDWRILEALFTGG